MKTTTVAIIGSSLAVLIGAICLVPNDAEARRFGGVRARPHVHARAYVRHPGARVVARNNWRYGRYYRPGRWVNGVWLVNGVAASVAVGTASNCAYYWRQWKATGRSYWRDRYNENCT
jgi:hypothetical protein